MKLKFILVGCTFFSVVSSMKAQEFVNGDLEGIVTGISVLAPNWSAIPYTDSICLATASSNATPDLTDLTGPFLSIGLNGNPFSGNTFMSGLYQDITGQIWHEGIMQQVSGFIPGNIYPLNFHQAVIKQGNAIDSSGSWNVYIDSVLVGTSIPTINIESYDSIYVVWEQRTINFTASSTTHMIQFLPMDDDSNIFDPHGIRMGIDCIYINTPCSGALSIHSYTENPLVSVYPNPVFDNLNIQVEMNGACELIIYDLTSRRILNYSFEKNLEAPVSQLRKGIYFYELRMDNEILKQGKFIKE